jgi:hypothetical protein
MRSKEEYKALLQETVEYYSVDPENKRGFDEERELCEYVTDEGQMCAVGRCMSDEGRRRYGSYEGDYEDLIGTATTQESIFPEERLGYANQFWRDVQSLHDVKAHWDKDGLTPLGEEARDGILRLIEDGAYYIKPGIDMYSLTPSSSIDNRIKYLKPWRAERSEKS